MVSLCTPRAADGHAPIEVIVPEARRMPLYRLINDPFGALQERSHVKPTATMADLLCRRQAAAWIRSRETIQRSPLSHDIVR